MPLDVLIADDAADIAQAVAFGARMTWPGCRVRIARSGAEALTLFREQPADLIVLDVAMPPPDGLIVLREIRASSQVPILMLTVHDATIDKIRALDLGADDYLTKPFDHLELLARLRALVRRAASDRQTPGQRIVSGDLMLDVASRQVSIAGEVVKLTSTEYRLLEALARQAGVTVPHHILIERVWGSEWASDPSAIKVFVRRLRQKLGDDSEHPRYIQTDWGHGYRLVASEAGAR